MCVMRVCMCIVCVCYPRAANHYTTGRWETWYQNPYHPFIRAHHIIPQLYGHMCQAGALSRGRTVHFKHQKCVNWVRGHVSPPRARLMLRDRGETRRKIPRFFFLLNPNQKMSPHRDSNPAALSLELPTPQITASRQRLALSRL
ncbi:hypothetical protein OE88DRAFT_121122 [Heliocybe sulcata]|uniref:Secreted protein n=1 Tax=Heliocybe sulcata TaxID=5364 RepID=A0A5C3NHE0_9AGAM|nr:hypothetical protein OE88DRAFT_121122 [Heliocybe sulcata]